MHRTWRIAYVDGGTEVGGAERVLLNLLNHLPNDRVEPILLCGGEGELTRQAAELGIQYQTFRSPTFRSLSITWRTKRFLDPVAVVYNAAALTVAARELASALRDFTPDLIQTNTMMAHFYGSLAARSIGKPCIWHIHDVLEGNRLGGLGGAFWRSIALWLPDRVAGVSHYSVSALGKASKVEVIYCGTSGQLAGETSNWRLELALGHDSILVGYIGRIGQVKGLETLVRAAYVVCNHEPRAHFVLIGAPLFGEEAYQQRILAMVTQLGLDARVHLVGFWPDAAARLADLDCIVLPSNREALGQVLLEAGLAGKPVVATTVGGIPEVVVDQITGILVPPQDPEHLAGAILNLIRNPGLARRLGETAREHIVRNFGIEHTVSRWLGLYERVLVGSRGEYHV